MKFNNIKSLDYQKGITLFLTVAIMSIFLITGLALNVMLMTRLKMKEGVSNSLMAFLAADTGLEDELFFGSIGNSRGQGSPPTYTENFGSTSYTVIIKTEGDEAQDPICKADTDPNTSFSCIFSTGKFSQSQRRVSMKR